jgi:hypothetical protein
MSPFSRGEEKTIEVAVKNFLGKSGISRDSPLGKSVKSCSAIAGHLFTRRQNTKLLTIL